MLAGSLSCARPRAACTRRGGSTKPDGFFKQSGQNDAWPVARVISSVFAVYGLLVRVKELARRAGAGWFFARQRCQRLRGVSLLTRLPDSFWLVLSGAFGFLVSGLKAFYRTLPRPNGVPLRGPTGFSGWQLVLLVVGVAFWGTVLIELSLFDNSWP